MQVSRSGRGLRNTSQTNAQNNSPRIPVQNEADPEKIPFPEKQNQSRQQTLSTSVPLELWNNQLATSGNQHTRCQNKETPHHPQNIHPKIIAFLNGDNNQQHFF